MSIFKNKYFKFIYALVGTAIAAASLNLFLIPNHLAAGGVSGLSTVLNFLTSMPVGVISVICNIPLYILSYVYESRAFVIKTIITTMFLGLFIDIFSFLPRVVDDLVLASIFGGILTGVGYGMVLQVGASTGGTDIVAKVVNKKFKHISIGSIIFVVDMLVIAFAVLVFKNIYTGLYSVVALYVSSKVIDLLVEGVNFAKLAYIITDESEKTANEIITTLNRGATFLNGKGVYTKNDKNVILCTIKKSEITKLKELVFKTDPTAFVIITEAREVLGEGFMDI